MKNLSIEELQRIAKDSNLQELFEGITNEFQLMVRLGDLLTKQYHKGYVHGEKAGQRGLLNELAEFENANGSDFVHDDIKNKIIPKVNGTQTDDIADMLYDCYKADSHRYAEWVLTDTLEDLSIGSPTKDDILYYLQNRATYQKENKIIYYLDKK